MASWSTLLLAGCTAICNGARSECNFRNLTFVGGTTVLALAGHFIEIALWSLVLYLCGGVADISSALYCSAGSYTTVGSGDVVLSSRWKLLGPFEAAAGMLMFGVSTALIFAVIQILVQARLDRAKYH